MKLSAGAVRNACPSGKVRWNRRAGAHRRAKKLTATIRCQRNRKTVAREEVAAYYCEQCSGWHVGSLVRERWAA